MARVGKIFCTRADASLYVMPYSRDGRFYFGTHGLPNDAPSSQLKYTDQLTSETAPKVSIHESGVVHVHAGGQERAGPLRAPRLPAWRGEHIATLIMDRFDDLQPHTGQPRFTGSTIDLVCSMDERAVESARWVVYANGAAPEFAVPCVAMLTLSRPHLSSPIYFGINPRGMDPLDPNPTDDRGGVLAIAGWDPTPGANLSMVYLRVE